MCVCALSHVFFSQMFSVLFFFMLFVLGIGSNIAMCTCIITILRDKFKLLKAWQAAVGLSIVGFLFGIAYVTPVWMTINKIKYRTFTYDLLCSTQFIGWTTNAELG